MSQIEATKFYIRYREGIPETEMQYYANQGFRTLGIETIPFEWVDDIKEINDLGPTVGIAGYVGDVWAGLNRLGKPIPPALDYPKELTEFPFLGRKIWKSTLGEVRTMVEPIFVKPIEQKAFTGFIWRYNNESRLRIVTHHDDTPVWCSELVKFVSEYRSFILYNKIIDCRHYKGDWAIAPDPSIVYSGKIAMGSHAPKAYAIDWGITNEGETLLVEANEAYSLGHYGLSPVSYARMLSARWFELAS